MFLDPIIPEYILAELTDLTLAENRNFALNTVGYPVLTSIVTVITLYILVTRQQFIRSHIARVFSLRANLSKYTQSHRTEVNVRGTCSSLRKKKTISKSGILDFASLSIGGIIIGSILTKKLFFAMILTQSMAPLIMPGDLIVTEAYTKNNITVGDVIVFTPRSSDNTFVHRVISVSEKGIRTQGDNANPDSWVLTDKDIQGKAVSVNQKPFVLKGLGYYFLPINSPAMASDPKYNTVRAILSIFQTFGPIISLMILLLILFPTRNKE